MTETASTARTSGRLEFLDAARGIAACAVVFQHTIQISYPAFLPWSLRHVNCGLVGVVVFFLISGFIIPVSIMRTKRLSTFWGSRFFRLYPIYWVSLVTALVLGWLGLMRLPAAFKTHPVLDSLVNFTMLQSFLRAPDALPVYWTLSLELVFYVLCSLLFIAGWLNRSLLWGWLASGSMALGVFIAGVGFHRSVPAGRIGLLVTAFLGTVIYSVYSKRQVQKHLYPLLAFTLATFAAGFWFRFQQYPSHSEAENYSVAGVLASWVAAYTLFAVLFLLRASEFPGWTLWIGRISYSLYLVHGMVLALLPRTLNPVVFPCVAVSLSFAISAASYQWIEKPAIDFYRKVRAPKPSFALHG
ncbi:MAG TPA: acyltransferase [Acidobacteriaceae bacterium]|nr:acyltransferase [Acidobacteriaceae bacterium]